MTNVTELLSALGQGDPHAASRLLPLAHMKPRCNNETGARNKRTVGGLFDHEFGGSPGGGSEQCC